MAVLNEYRACFGVFISIECFFRSFVSAIAVNIKKLKYASNLAGIEVVSLHHQKRMLVSAVREWPVSHSPSDDIQIIPGRDSFKSADGMIPLQINGLSSRAGKSARCDSPFSFAAALWLMCLRDSGFRGYPTGRQ